MTPKDIQPALVVADEQGNIYDDPDLGMLCRRGQEIAPPRPDELIALPDGSDLFLLPGRQALGMNPGAGEVVVADGQAVAAFVCPGFTLSAHPAYLTADDAPTLPLYAYGAVGYARGRFWVCARRVDTDKRQVFSGIPAGAIEQGARELLRRYPDNRLVRHLTRCALTYCCPAARNLALGRYEAPLPTSRSCNARCIGCISRQPDGSGFCATQQRITFRPSPLEIQQVMHHHARREKRPIFSFGQGCEGEPLTEARLIRESVAGYREKGGRGTINLNTNASLPEWVEPLARSGLDSIRVSLNSATRERYLAYYRPEGYSFEDVTASIREAKRHGLFVSLNLLFFPGLTDSEEELDALCSLAVDTRLDFIQLRNLNLDPELYLDIQPQVTTPCTGLANFMKRLRKACPWLKFGYFNPYVEEAQS